jgi:hypothetical protein
MSALPVGLEPYQERVVAELKELIGRREKLAVFIVSPVFDKLPKEERQRLRRQFDIMIEYEAVLQERIDHFPK